MAITQGVELPQTGQTGFKHALATLLVHVLFQIAGQRRSDFDRLIGQKRRQVFLARFVEDRQVAAVHDPDALRASAADQFAKMGIQLRRAPGQVQRRDPPRRQVAQQQFNGLPIHGFGALGTGRHMAMGAGLVAAVAQVGLQGIGAVAINRRKVSLQQQGKGVAHTGSLAKV